MSRATAHTIAAAALALLAVYGALRAGSEDRGDRTPAVPLVTASGGLPPAMARANGFRTDAPAQHPQASRADSRRWAEARTRFLSGASLSALVQEAFAVPTPPLLFYAREAFRHCTALRAALATSNSPEAQRFRDRQDNCRQLWEINPSREQFEARHAAAVARMTEREQAVLRAADAPAVSPARFNERLAVLARYEDIYLLAQVGSRWAAKLDATYQGRSLSAAERSAFVTAWSLVACDTLGTCETSESMANLCGLAACEETLRASIEKLESPERVRLLKDLAGEVRRAIESGDFSAFD